MAIQIKCGSKDRRNAVKNHSILNGIDYLEIMQRKGKDMEEDEGPSHLNASSPSPIILVFCFKTVKEINTNNVVIRGGVRIRDIKVESVLIGPSIKKMIDDSKLDLTLSDDEIDRLIVVSPSTNGDFSPYKLKLVDSTVSGSNSPPEGFDILLSEINFSFNVECLGDFDCKVKRNCPVEVSTEPDIDYMAKDYSSFLKLMLNRMSAIMPDWKERNPADLGIVLVELLAYVGDHLSYYQDSVSTEAYLGTARKRISLKRHARLLDYVVNEGCNARAWICFEVNRDHDSVISLPKGVKLCTREESKNGNNGKYVKTPVITNQEFKDLLIGRAEAFETMYAVTLHNALNEMRFYTWGDSRCCLPKGATHASLRNDDKKLDGLLKVGNIIIFDQIQLPDNLDGLDYAGYTDSSLHTHAVRITEITTAYDDLTEPKTSVLDISWSEEDALPFSLCLWDIEGVDSAGKKTLYPVSVARGNVVLADHGYTFPLFSTNEESLLAEELGIPEENKSFSPKLALRPITNTWPFDPSYPAEFAFRDNIENVLPYIKIKEWHNLNGKRDPLEKPIEWSVKRDLFSSDKFARDFIVEIDNDGTANIRFGDDKLGSRPQNNSSFGAIYRVGNGKRGNVGANTITQMVDPDSVGLNLENKIIKVYNPIEAKGGRDPESLEEIRQYAPTAFRTQNRAVTEQDYVDILSRHPQVNRAFAMIRWTGSWYTVFVTIDRFDGKDVDPVFKKIIYDYLNEYRLAGIDLEIQSPLFAPLDIEMRICVTPGYFRSDVKQELTDLFSSSILLNGTGRGFFHPDNFTFGQPVFISQIYKLAMDVEGVSSVNIDRFQRLGKTENGELDAGVIRMESYEIARLDNDPNFPENGKLSIVMEGGGL